MTRSPMLAWRPLAAMAILLLAAFALPASADPPARAARISLVTASASFSPAGSDDWLQARINRPVWIGDRLWSGDGRVELQIGGASMRLAPRTLLRVLNFDDRLAQFEVTEGSIALHVRAIDREDAIEIDTPTFAFVTREEGDYRIDVDRDRTAVSVRRGFGDIYGSRVAYRIDRREQFVFYDTDLRDYDVGALPPPDPFDRWARERAQREDASQSARYVNPELVGFADLDAHGEWRSDTTYGNVWVPRVSAEWAPYRYGHWTWVDPWGWTWIDDAPWGFAATHYGRWALIGRTWAWVPGPREVRPVYSPALVAWVGGDNFSVSVSSGRSRGVAWFPLAPGEVWRPPYDVSREYFARVNVANTTINQVTVNNFYESRARAPDVRYRYRDAPVAITAVPVETMVRSRPVQQNVVQVTNNVTVNVPVVAAPPAQPTVQSFAGAAPASQAKPPAEAVNRPVVARTAPPAAVPTLQDRAAIIQSQQGRPVDRAALDKVAPQVQGAPAPGSTHVLPPSGSAKGQAPAERAAPNQLRANVRVVESEKGTPQAPPPENARASSRGKGEGRDREARRETQPAPQAAQPQPPQAAQPQPPQAAQPQPPQAAQPQPPQAAQPQPPQAAQPQPPQAAQPQPPQAAQPRSPQAPSEDARAGRGKGDDREREPRRDARPEPPAAQPQAPQAAPPQPSQPQRPREETRAQPPAAPQAAPQAAPSGGPPSDSTPGAAKGRAERAGGPPRDADAPPGQRSPARAPTDAVPQGGRPPERPAAPPAAASPPQPAAAPPTQGQPERPRGAPPAVSDEARRAQPGAGAPPRPAQQANPPSKGPEAAKGPDAKGQPAPKSDKGEKGESKRDRDDDDAKGKGKDRDR